MDDTVKKMKEFMAINETFTEYVKKDMTQYNRSLNDVLRSPITQAYYESLLPNGCNYKGGNHNDV